MTGYIRAEKTDDHWLFHHDDDDYYTLITGREEIRSDLDLDTVGLEAQRELIWDRHQQPFGTGGYRIWREKS